MENDSPDPRRTTAPRNGPAPVDYARRFPVSLHRTSGDRLVDDNGHRYIDFHTGAGVFNYGHNPVVPTPADGGTGTEEGAPWARYCGQFRETILAPRELDYRLVAAGSSATDALEIALEIARRNTGRATVVPFTNATQRLSLDPLTATDDEDDTRRDDSKLDDGVFIPFNCFYGEHDEPFEQLRTMIYSNASGIDQPAAVIVEAVQLEGGLNVAEVEWLRAIEQICRENSILLIVDEGRLGCGRTGSFFSFETSGIRPDIVCLSGSLSGCADTFALVLVDPALPPGEIESEPAVSGTTLAQATRTLQYWQNDTLERAIANKAATIEHILTDIAANHPHTIVATRGCGLARGIAVASPELAHLICRQAFHRGLLIDASGPQGEVVRLLPALTIDDSTLAAGLEQFRAAVEAATVQYHADSDAA